MNAALSVTKTKKKRRLRKSTSRQRRRRSERPTIRFTPYAWAKLLYLRDEGDTEIGGFAITSPDDLLLVQDVCLVHQQCTAMNVEIDYSQTFEASNVCEWQREFATSVRKVQRRNPFPPLSEPGGNNQFFNETAEYDPGDSDVTLDQFGDDEDWFDRLNSAPLFLDWEYDECETPLSTIAV